VELEELLNCWNCGTVELWSWRNCGTVELWNCGVGGIVELEELWSCWSCGFFGVVGIAEFKVF
jgi:hypothetical protein